MKKFLSVACLAALFSSSVNANDNIAEFELGINDSNNIDVILKVKEDLKINNIRGFKGNCKIYYLKYASKFLLNNNNGIISRWDGETRGISETEIDETIKNYLNKYPDRYGDIENGKGLLIKNRNGEIGSFDDYKRIYSDGSDNMTADERLYNTLDDISKSLYVMNPILTKTIKKNKGVRISLFTAKYFNYQTSLKLKKYYDKDCSTKGPLVLQLDTNKGTINVKEKEKLKLDF